MKILMSAYACEPHRGSESGIGWNVAREMAQHHEVWIITRPDECKDKIEAELDKNPIENLHFVYFNVPLISGLWKLGQSGPMQIHYYFWQLWIYFVGKKLNNEIGFDIIHHVTFNRYTSPNSLAFLGVPFVFGPVGGGETSPPEFIKTSSLKNRVYELLRSSWRRLGEIDPLSRMTVQKSAIAYASTPETANRLAALGSPNIKLLSNAALPRDDIKALESLTSSTDLPSRFLSLGRLLHWKGFHLGLQAFAAADLLEAEYWVVGDGPELNQLTLLAQELGISHRTKFFGLVPRQEALRLLGESTALVHPSLHDSGGWVCLEAMSSGRPVICLDLGGPALIVDQQTGFKVAAQHPDQVVKDLALAMKTLHNDPSLRLRMANAAQERVRNNFTWERAIQRFADDYHEIIAKY